MSALASRCSVCSNFESLYYSQQLPRLHARYSRYSRTCTSAKRTATQQKPEEQADQRNPADFLTPYEPYDDEGNPWWSPPESDVWEGGAWEWLGRGGAVALPALLAIGVVIGLFSAANYVLPGEDTPQETLAPATSDKTESGLDLMLRSNGESGSSTNESSEIKPF